MRLLAILFRISASPHLRISASPHLRIANTDNSRFFCVPNGFRLDSCHHNYPCIVQASYMLVAMRGSGGIEGSKISSDSCAALRVRYILLLKVNKMTRY